MLLKRSTLLAARLRPAARFSNYRLRALSSKQDEPQTTKPADGAPSTEAYDKDGKPLPSIPDATTLFKLSNPELMLDPRKNASWMVVFSVIAFFGTYMTWTAWREGLIGDGGQRMAEEQAKSLQEELDVQRELPDGRLLLRDGSIVKRKK